MSTPPSVPPPSVTTPPVPPPVTPTAPPLVIPPSPPTVTAPATPTVTSVPPSTSNLIRGVSVYFLYLDSNKQTRAVQISEKFGWARRIDVKDKNTYEFSVVGSHRTTTIPPAPTPPTVSDSLDLSVDENGVARYRFYTGPDIKSRIASDGVYSPTEDEPDWWLLTRPGMVPHQPQQTTRSPNSRRGRRNPPSTNNVDRVATGVPKSAKVRFYKEPSNNNEIEEIEIQFFV
jgi:hypothetical protein